MEFGTYQIPSLDTDPQSVLLLSGDIHVGARAIKSGWLINLSQRFPYVLYVLGNHEFYGDSLDRCADRIREELAKRNISNVIVLDNKAFEIPDTDVKVIGGTMWTDFNRGNPLSMHDAQMTMNDYKKIRNFRHTRRLLPNHLLQEHYKFKDFLLNELAKPWDGRVFVSTHHAPHQLSVHVMYENDYHGNAAYASDLSNEILDHPQIKYWFHGHMHNSSDYIIGECNVICNPYGYKGVVLNDSFNPTFRVKL